MLLLYNVIPVGLFAGKWIALLAIRYMIHAPEAGAIIRLHFLAPVSGACVMQLCDRIFLWYQIQAPIRTQF